VPEIYTDSAMPVNAKIAMGRDESDFYAAVGIVGEGPLGAYGAGHKLDGQPHHGYPGSLGLLENLGPDPNPTPFGFDTDGPAITERAAGTAFVMIRRSDSKGLQLSRLSEHAMEVAVSQGLGGWTWTAPGNRAWQSALTNPIWIAVNMVMRARGLRAGQNLTAQQLDFAETLFDVDAAVAAAAICDQQVAKLIGSGNETQFKFRGVLQEAKPLRDWLQEVMMNCLGYYTFANGKLKFGVRVNSSAAEAFTEGNILFRSLQLAPLRPGFNHLTANFADEDYQYVANSISLYDIDHATLVGGGAGPLFLKSTVNLAGTASKSQAARIITTRLREELGGISQSEWERARQISCKTTVLALNTELGMVCSLTHPDMPGGSGKFRVTGWRLNGDYSIDVQGRTVTDSMYDMLVGPKPQDVPPDPLPQEQIPEIPIKNLALVSTSLDDETQQVTIQMSGTAPQLEGLSHFRCYVEVPTEDDPNPANPTLPGQLSFVANQYAKTGAPVLLELSVPYPRFAWLQGLSSKQVRWIFYVATSTWREDAPLVRLTQLNPPQPVGATPHISVLLDFTAWVQSGGPQLASAAEIQSASMEYRDIESGWAYRIAITLGGAALTNIDYGGTDVWLRFADEPAPPQDEGWTALRHVAVHHAGAPATVYSDWYEIRPGTSMQFYLRPVSRSESGAIRRWGQQYGPTTISLGLGSVLPGAGHNFGLQAILSGYWDDGNGVRLGKVDVSWTPLSKPGIVYGIWEARTSGSSPPAYGAFQRTEANTASSNLTMWVAPPKGSAEYLHLALICNVPDDGIWPSPTDYPQGGLPVASVFLPIAGLSDQVTGFAVTVETDQTQDIPRGRFVFAFTPPSDPDYHHVHIYRRPANSSGQPIGDWLPDKVASIMVGGPGGWWPLPSAPEYWIFKSVSCNSLGQENTASPPEFFIAVPTSSGVSATKAKPAMATGPLTVDGAGRITTASNRDVPVIVGSDPTTLPYQGSNFVYWTANGRIYRWNGSAYVAVVNSSEIKAQLQIDGLTAAEFAASIEPIRIFSSVPGSFNGRTIYNTGDGKLYRWNGSAYVLPLTGSEIKDQLTVNKLEAGQISAGAIGTQQLSTTEILVGGGSGKPPRFVVKDAFGATIGFMGDDGAGFVGMWSARGRFGGTFASPKIDLSSTSAQLNDVVLTVNSFDTYSYTTEISPTNGLMVSSSFANLRGKLRYGYLQFEPVSGGPPYSRVDLSGITASDTSNYPHSYARLHSGSGIAYVQIGDDTTRGLRMAVTSSAAALISLGAGAYVAVNEYRISSNVVIDSSANFRWANVYNENLDLGNLTATKWVPAYDSSGTYLGKIPIIP